MKKYKCKHCGGELEESGNYEYDCPNDCFPMTLELNKMIEEEE